MARRNPTYLPGGRLRTDGEGRVLKIDGHTKKAASKLLNARREAEIKHQRKPRRAGNLTYQSAQAILRWGKHPGSTRRAPERVSRREEPDAPALWEWLHKTWGIGR